MQFCRNMFLFGYRVSCIYKEVNLKVSVYKKLISVYFMFWKDEILKCYGDVLFIYIVFQKLMEYLKD